MSGKRKSQPWYAGEHQDVIFYLMTAIFFIELIVGGIAFFYGIMHAAPDTPGGPPVARFPWLAWSLAAILSPIGLILIVHLAGAWVSNAITRDDNMAQTQTASDNADLPPKMRRFYQAVQHAPTVVILVALLLAGAALFFIDGALTTLGHFGNALIPYIPWIAGTIGALLAICFLTHAVMVYRQRKMENEYAWRREVLQKTGLVLMDKNSIALPQSAEQVNLAALPENTHKILDVAIENEKDDPNDPENSPDTK